MCIEFFLIGYNFYYLQDLLGIYSLNSGLDYYGEIHNNSLNILIHGIFIPFTIYGILLSVPVLFKLNNENALLLRYDFYAFYIGLYLQLDIFYTLIFAIIYYFPLKYANIHYNNDYITLIKGISISFISLFIQEFVGHYIGGDKPSRIDGVLNAVFYAKYFGIKETILLGYNIIKQ